MRISAAGKCFIVGSSSPQFFARRRFAQQFDQKLFSEMRWRCIGPFRGGRTVAITGVPHQPNVFYMAAVNGGVWKTTDFGNTWNPIFDDQPTGSVGALAVAPSDPNIIYVGSGEGLQRPDLATGDGVYKSTDAGKTWTHLGPARRAANHRDPRRSQRSKSRLRRRRRPSLRPQRRTRRFSLHRRRPIFPKSSLQRRKHRRCRSRFRSRKSANHLRRAVGRARRSVGSSQRRFHLHRRQRTLQIHRRRKHLAPAHKRSAHRRRRSRPHRHRRCAVAAQSPLRHHRSQARRRGHLSLRRCR